MAVNIDTVYQKVLAIANKEQRGYITPQEFNLFAEQAQLEIFEQYFYDLNQLSRVHGKSEEYSDIVHNLNEKVALFESIATITSAPATPTVGTINVTNLYRLGTVIDANYREVEEVQQNELLYILQSPLAAPSLTRYIYVRTGELTIEMRPVVQAGTTGTYVRRPTKPSWGYVVVGHKALFDATNPSTNNFDLHQSEENELVYKILRLAGVSMKRPDIMGAGQGMDTMQVQQEKQ